jgi:hemerythrin-like domain-containing protein/SAM-dependent methyltransferase
MVRHPALRDLSSDHHQALVQGNRLQKWAHADAAGRQKIVTDYLRFWQEHGQRHFCEEEQALLPYFAHWGDLDQEPIRQMLREHALIRRDVQLLKENPARPEEFFTAAGKLLEGHVRLEERVVFPLIEQTLPEPALNALPAALAAWQSETSITRKEEKMMSQTETVKAPENLPGANLQTHKMPGHWLLARLGKKVLRPGGLELTRQMLEELHITADDDVVEFAPGLGATAELALEKNPASYTAVDRDEAAIARLRQKLNRPNCRFHLGTAEETHLPDESASVVYGEAMLTMQTLNTKQKIVSEAARLLKPGGRYGIHELSLLPDDLDQEKEEEVCKAMGGSIHVGARPLRVREWRALLEEAGFEIVAEHRTPMELLEPGRLIADEGLSGAVHIVWNALHDEEALSRVREMRSVFRKYKDHLGAISLVGRKAST